MTATIYLALDDECSFEEYPDGLRIEAFLSMEMRLIPVTVNADTAVTEGVLYELGRL